MCMNILSLNKYIKYKSQKTILEVYAILRNTKEKLRVLGHPASLPSAEDLRVMNVANMSPGQLLQLCAGSKVKKEGSGRNDPGGEMRSIAFSLLF